MKNIFRLLPLCLLAVSLAFTAGDKKTVIIDVAHGGKDSGNTTENVLEKEIVLQIAQKIVALNDDPNLEIILTRDSDKSLSLSDRVKLVNSKDADLLISLHLNSATASERTGVEMYITENNSMKEHSARLAQTIKASLEKDFEVAEIKKANFKILKGTNCPAALIEMGFLSNPSERAFLQSESGQEKMARAIYQALK